MRWFVAVCFVFLGIFEGSAAAQPGGATASSTTWIAGAPAHTRIMATGPGETYVGVWIDVPATTRATVARAPMAVSLVIDTSGSMAGQKIGHARIAAASLLESLAAGDIVSIYGFSTAVTEIAPPTVLSAASRASLMQSVQSLMAMGSTNMYDGLRLGIERTSSAPGSHPVRRVIVISDGHANVGPSDPASLGALAANGTEYGTQVTAIGVGLYYDEQTLGALAVNSSGRLYHLEQPHQMAQILRNELQLLTQTVAVSSTIEIVPAPGVVIISGATKGAQLENNRLKLPLGTVYAGQRRELLFKARVNTARLGSAPLATARLVYRKPGRGARTLTQKTVLRVEVTRDAAAVGASSNAPVRAMVANHHATAAQLRAVTALNRGDATTATRELRFAESQLNGAVRGAPRVVQRQLQRRARGLAKARTRAGQATTRTQQRASALENNDMAYDAAGF